MHKIEKGILPPKGRNTNLAKYPFAEMDVNDSFVVTDIKERQVVRAAAYEFAKRHGKKFITRSVENDQTRVWRIE